jgi:hypothetical protein
VLIILLANGIKEFSTSLKCCRANGILMMVMNRMNPKTFACDFVDLRI